MPLVSIEGAFDMHVHTHPCLFPRICDDRTAVEAAAAAGLKGMMIKCHHESTVSRARDIQKDFAGFHVFGGIVLNEYVGGINPAAVEAALKMGGKEVWMPTIDAANHARAHGTKGKYDVQEGGKTSREEDLGGITIFDSGGKVNKATREVLSLIAQYDVILGTCHLSHEEIFALVPLAKEMGVKKILVTHPYFKVPGLSIDQMRSLVEMGATMEFGYCTVSPMWHYATVQQVAATIRQLGAENCIIISDAGQRHNPMPHESLRVFAQCLYECGLSKDELSFLMTRNPEKLLNLS